jgi:multidrug efflux pump
VATVYDELNQYRVIMEVAPRYARSPLALNDVQCRHAAPAGTATATTTTATAVNPALRDSSTGQAVSSHGHAHGAAVGDRQLRRELDTDVRQPPGRRARDHGVVQPAEGVMLAEAQAAVRQAEADIGCRPTCAAASRARRAARRSRRPAALADRRRAGRHLHRARACLYESLVHPITVLSTLPSAGVGAVLALLMFKMEFRSSR